MKRGSTQHSRLTPSLSVEVHGDDRGNNYIAIAGETLRPHESEHITDRAWTRTDIRSHPGVQRKLTDKQLKALNGEQWYGWHFQSASIKPNEWMTLPGQGGAGSFPSNATEQI